jgi:uncharacterized protein (DUF58 family)
VPFAPRFPVFPNRAVAWLRDHLFERVTPGGVLYAALVLATGAAAFAAANNLLFLLLSLMLATVLVSGLISRLGIASLELDARLPDHVCARRRTPARLVLRNLKRRVPSFSIRVVGVEGSVFTTPVYFPLVRGGEELETAIEVVFERRGLHRGDSFQFSSRFPFGLSERRVRVLMNRDVLVYPALDPQPGYERLLAEIAGESESPLQGRGHDFYRIRPYEPFESARHVDWRATAHTGALQVREFAREQDPLIVIVLDLYVGLDQRAWFERAVEGCAFLAWRMSERGARLHFRTQDFELMTPAEGDVHAILKYLALVEPRARELAPKRNREPAVTIVFTADPERLDSSAWAGARLLHPGCFPSEPDNAGPR